MSTQTLQPQSVCPIFITAIEELPKGLPISCGTFFSGQITYTKDENRKNAKTYLIRYVIDTEEHKKKETKDQKKSEKSMNEQFNEALNELKITWISKYLIKCLIKMNF
jgi:hypothetical protein